MNKLVNIILDEQLSRLVDEIRLIYRETYGSRLLTRDLINYLFINIFKDGQFLKNNISETCYNNLNEIFKKYNLTTK